MNNWIINNVVIKIKVIDIVINLINQEKYDNRVWAESFKKINIWVI